MCFHNFLHHHAPTWSTSLIKSAYGGYKSWNKEAVSRFTAISYLFFLFLALLLFTWPLECLSSELEILLMLLSSSSTAIDVCLDVLWINGINIPPQATHRVEDVELEPNGHEGNFDEWLGENIYCLNRRWYELGFQFLGHFFPEQNDNQSQCASFNYKR